MQSGWVSHLLISTKRTNSWKTGSPWPKKLLMPWCTGGTAMFTHHHYISRSVVLALENLMVGSLWAVEHVLLMLQFVCYYFWWCWQVDFSREATSSAGITVLRPMESDINAVSVGIINECGPSGRVAQRCQIDEFTPSWFVDFKPDLFMSWLLDLDTILFRLQVVLHCQFDKKYFM